MARTIIFFIIFAFCLPLFAGDEQEFFEIKTRYGFKVKRRPPLAFQVYLDFDSLARPILHTSVSIQNDALQFEKTKDGYRARYRITLGVRNDSTALQQFSKEHTLLLKDFSRTNSLHEHQQHHYVLNQWPEDFHLTAGAYTCLMEIEDLVSHKRTAKQLVLHLKDDFTRRVSSDICFLLSHPDSSNSFQLAPYSANLDFNVPYYAYMQVRADSTNSAPAQIELRREGKILVKEDVNPVTINGLRRVVYPLFQDTLSEGAYSLKIKIGKVLEKKNFKVVWFRKPTYLYEVDLAIRPMRYILTQAQQEEIESLNTQALNDWFRDFWKRRDPSPLTPFNELLAEFYHRVSESNFKFSTRHKEGWETDRGRILILYGPPKNIENGRYATQSLPYLVWTYPDSSSFLFVDKKRNGEFKLQELNSKEDDGSN